MQELEKLKKEYVKLHKKNRFAGLRIVLFSALFTPSLILYLLASNGIINPLVMMPLTRLLIVTSVFGVIFSAVPAIREVQLDGQIKKIQKLQALRELLKQADTKSLESKEEKTTEPNLIQKMNKQKLEYKTPEVSQIDMTDPLYASTMEDFIDIYILEDELDEEIEISRD